MGTEIPASRLVTVNHMPNFSQHRVGSSLDYRPLEKRQLLAVTFHAGNGDLNIQGTNSSDAASVFMVDSTTLRATLNGVSTDFTANDVQRVLFFGYAGDDQFQNNTSIATSAFGSDGNDTLTGGSGNDLLSGGNDNDVISGGDGNDTISGNAGDDDLSGGNGNDSIYGGSGNDMIFAGAGQDFVSGSGGDDTIEGGNDADVLSGNNGADTINGDGGNDTIYGGNQNDNLYGDDGDDLIFGLNHNDNVYGGDGDDNLRGQSGDDLVEGNSGNDQLSGNNGFDTVRGGTGDDTIYGGHHDDNLFGDEGDDLIAGNTGNDHIEGGNDNDTLSGNSGQDTIWAGTGNDNLYGGLDADYLYGETGLDRLFGAGGADLLFGGTGSDFLDGGDGNDRLYGETDADELFGGDGNDGLFGGIGGGDQITGNEGSDRFLIWTGDTMVDRNDLEAQIEFRNETSSWNEYEIQIVDDGLHWLMERANTSLVVRDSLDTDPVVYSKWSNLGGAIGINSLTTYFNSLEGFTYDREIQFLEWNENSSFYNEQVVLTTIHEVGHSWDSDTEINAVLAGGVGQLWTNFTTISQWTDTNPNSSQFQQSHDGEWWYNSNSDFAYNYGRTNPYEDWATMWEAVYEAEHGTNHSAIANKIDIFDQLMAAFASA